MLKLQVNELLYASFKKQVVCCGVLFMLVGVLLYQMMLTPMLADLQVEKARQQQLQLEQEHAERILQMDGGGAITAAKMQSILKNIAEENNILLRMETSGGGMIETKTLGAYASHDNFLQALLETEELMAIEKLSLEKNKNIISKINIRFLEAGDA